MCVPKEGGSGGIYGTARPRGRGEWVVAVAVAVIGI